MAMTNKKNTYSAFNDFSPWKASSAILEMLFLLKSLSILKIITTTQTLVFI